MAYATPGELNTLAQTDVPEQTATLLLELVAGAVDREAGRALASAERTETVDASGRDTLWLDWPITAVTSVVVDGEALTVDDDYTWSRSGYLTRKGGRWTDAVTVTYTAGFAADSPELTLAKTVSLIVAADIAANPHRLASLTTDGTAMTFGPGLSIPDEWRGPLRKLRSRRRLA